MVLTETHKFSEFFLIFFGCWRILGANEAQNTPTFMGHNRSRQWRGEI